MVKLGLTVHEWKADSILSQDFIIVASTGVLPRLLIEPVGQIPESRVVNDSRHIDHWEVDAPRRCECHNEMRYGGNKCNLPWGLASSGGRI